MKPPEHGLLHSVWLHLAPGLVMLAFYVAAAPWVMRWGYPPLFASLLTIPFILVPWMVGYLMREARRTPGAGPIGAALHFRRSVPLWQYFAIGIPIILWGALVFQLAEAFLTPSLRSVLGRWLPGWFMNPAEFDVLVALPGLQLVVFFTALLLFAGLVAPIVEEWYFRGHLMAGLSRFGWWAPVLSVALFTLYHFESPWENPARFLMVLPMALVVWGTKSLRLAVVMHVALNLLSAGFLLAAVLSTR